jgi:hypothetical protein
MRGLLGCLQLLPSSAFGFFLQHAWPGFHRNDIGHASFIRGKGQALEAVESHSRRYLGSEKTTMAAKMAVTGYNQTEKFVYVFQVFQVIRIPHYRL